MDAGMWVNGERVVLTKQYLLFILYWSIGKVLISFHNAIKYIADKA